MRLAHAYNQWRSGAKPPVGSSEQNNLIRNKSPAIFKLAIFFKIFGGLSSPTPTPRPHSNSQHMCRHCQKWICAQIGGDCLLKSIFYVNSNIIKNYINLLAAEAINSAFCRQTQIRQTSCVDIEIFAKHRSTSRDCLNYKPMGRGNSDPRIKACACFHHRQSGAETGIYGCFAASSEWLRMH